MYSEYHQIARSRQADLVREAQLAYLAAQARAGRPRLSLSEKVRALAASIPHVTRARAKRAALGPAHLSP